LRSSRLLCETPAPAPHDDGARKDAGVDAVGAGVGGCGVKIGTGIGMGMDIDTDDNGGVGCAVTKANDDTVTDGIAPLAPAVLTFG